MPDAARTGELRVGCSGWSYKDWKGIVYPVDIPQRRWFEHYQSLFDTVELNSTFYRLPTPEAVERWNRSAGPGFLYAVKLGAFGSHRMKLREPESWMANHLDRVRRLGEHLGPNLVQLPPRWTRNVERLDEFLSTVPPTMRWAVEVRERSWLHDDVFEVLRRHRVALCIHDLLADHPFLLTAPWTYLRFHGPNALACPYHGSYGETRLRAWADRIAPLLDQGRDVYAYFNNDWYGHAVTDAMFLRDQLAPPVTTHKKGGASLQSGSSPR